ncbi:MAG: biotin--[acetyl-CoA-carboxylase] ligase [Planctomycetes bacterium GWF2_42_9]|nr:MAG: biotin--[acetyl-CoA-carboxylase] ligase [Planctomycetes bacterium GWF2_42_9]HAL44648.1 biotin--[acetyl-CoA-carboxylase] ligase [Phycisphaerales bacterium]
MNTNLHELLDVEVIKKNLDTKRIGRKILVYKSTASTNDVARRYADGGEKNDGLAVFAEHQSEGRGRRGHKWFDGKNKSILCSILIFNQNMTADMISLVAAVAVANAIDKCKKAEAKIKWPNDIFVNDRKLSGILIEKKLKYYIIGIGINCHQQQSDFPPELASIATSIDIESTRVCDRNLLAKRLMFNFERFLEIAENNPDEIVEKWHDRSMLNGKRITVEHNSRQFTGICLGVEPSQGLILQLERGGVKMFDAATTTIVK